MKLKFVYLLSVFTLLFCAVLPVMSAEDGPYLGLEYGRETGLSSQDLRWSTAKIINTSLGLLGTVALVLIIYAGFKWMVSAGNEEEVGSAKKILFSAVLGLVIILTAYALTRFVMHSLFEATTGQPYSTILD